MRVTINFAPRLLNFVGKFFNDENFECFKANVSQENRVLCHVLRQFSIVLFQNTVHLKQNI